tara:strand:- start:4062 stop:4190 length:129 start_codon:yes stop_codon:yes gene_type:complete
MPHKITFVFFSLALLSTIVFADNTANRDVTRTVPGTAPLVED